METAKPALTRKGTSIIYENGIPIEVNTDFVDALIKEKPGVYSKNPSGKAGKQDDVKIAGPEKVKDSEKEQKSAADGKFTVEDLLALPYKTLQEMGKKLNDKGGKINTKAIKPELAKQLFEEANK